MVAGFVPAFFISWRRFVEVCGIWRRFVEVRGRGSVFDFPPTWICVYCMCRWRSFSVFFCFAEPPAVGFGRRIPARSEKVQTQSDAVMTKKDVQEMLQISERTLDVWRAVHGLPTVKIGSVCRFNCAVVLEWFQRFQESREPAGC